MLCTVYCMWLKNKSYCAKEVQIESKPFVLKSSCLLAQWANSGVECCYKCLFARGVFPTFRSVDVEDDTNIRIIYIVYIYIWIWVAWHGRDDAYYVTCFSSHVAYDRELNDRRKSVKHSVHLIVAHGIWTSLYCIDQVENVDGRELRMAKKCSLPPLTIFFFSTHSTVCECVYLGQRCASDYLLHWSFIKSVCISQV